MKLSSAALKWFLHIKMKNQHEKIYYVITSTLNVLKQFIKCNHIFSDGEFSPSVRHWIP